jgi:hypothetical protein
VDSFGIQCFIWIITDDKLQDWASLCAFGQKNKAPDAYRSVKQQEEALTAALVDVGIAA